MSEGRTELLFLGTGAADWPESGCGSGHRAFASLLVDSRILIDCTPGGLARLRQFKPGAEGIRDVFITHSHSDHFRIKALRELAGSGWAGGGKLRVHMDGAVAETAAEGWFEAVPLTAGRAIRAQGYDVLPLRANHLGDVPGETALHYLFSGANASFLYATDGAWMPAETWRALGGARLDALVVDCTIGEGHAGDYRIFEHNSLEMVRIMVDTMLRSNVLKNGASVLLTHMARTLHPGHEELQRALKAPFYAAYDGYIHNIII